MNPSRAGVESLETRRLLAAQIGISTSDGRRLFANGTEGADTISIQRVGIDDVFVRANDVTGTFDLDDFDSIDLFGNSGNDTISVSGSYPVAIELGGGDGNDTLLGGAGTEEFLGYYGDDLIRGGGGFDVIRGISDDGNDQIYGDDGGDSINGGGGNDTIYGGAGDDTIAGGLGANVIRGEAGNDQLGGGELADAIFGGDGDDSISLGAGNDYAEGNGGNDWIEGFNGSDTLLGGSGNDVLDGGDGFDSLVGGSGSNGYTYGETGFVATPVVFIGYSQTLVVMGTSGSDVITLQPVGIDDLRISINGAVSTVDADDMLGGRFVFADAGNDRVTLSGDLISDARLYGGPGNDTMTGGTRTVQMFGDTGNDRLFAGGSAGVLHGSNLVGGYGADLLQGGPNNDTLQSFGDSVIDTVIGGAGSDEGLVDILDVHREVEVVRIYPF
jgi:Ca2+-binding RTX toxin-like protein